MIHLVLSSLKWSVLTGLPRAAQPIGLPKLDCGPIGLNIMRVLPSLLSTGQRVLRLATLGHPKMAKTDRMGRCGHWHVR
jgi:hypothetical protein